MSHGANHQMRIVALAAIVAMLVLFGLMWVVQSSTHDEVVAQAAGVTPPPPSPDGTAAVANGSGSGAGTGGTPTPASAATRPASTSGDAAVPRPGAAAPGPYTIVTVTHALRITSKPGGGRVVGTVPTSSKYLHQPMRAWVREVSPNGVYGRVTIPWSGNDHAGWVRIAGLPRTQTLVHVRADLSQRRLRVLKGNRVLVNAPMAIGAVGSPSPTGEYWVTDPTPASGSFGSYAFGISALQPHPPAGWSGPNQMAIHGTNQPSSIGTRASAGCLRVGEDTLRRLRQLLEPGTPVEIVP